MELLTRSKSGIQPTPIEEVQAVAALLFELLTGSPPDSVNSGVEIKFPATAPATLRWVLNRALSLVDGEAGYNPGQLAERLQQIAAGQCLRDILADGKPILEEAVRHAIRLCNDLENDHVAGIIHQNLVAENVVLRTVNGQRRASWVDFEITSTVSVDDLTAERRADVQAVGRLLYEMLTGTPVPELPEALAAFKGASAWVKLGLDQIVLQAISADKDGYADITVLRDRLHHHLNYLGLIREIEGLIAARYPIIYITSWEEERTLEALRLLAQVKKNSLYAWSLSKGLRDETGRLIEPRTVDNPEVALDIYLSGKVKDTFLVFLDLHPFLRHDRVNDYPNLRRRLREAASMTRGSSNTLILLSPVLEFPPECEKDITVVSFPLPAAGDIADVLTQTIHLIERSGGQVNLSTADHEELVRAAAGLTLREAERAFTMAIMKKSVEQGQRVLDHDAIEIVLRDKERIVHKSGALEIFSSPESFGDIGGLEELKDWFTKRAKAFTLNAQEFGLPAPKGVLLVGVSGCGKSLAAKALASEWQKPLLRLDPSALFSSRVGSSEENLRNMFQVAETIAPSILWIDEIEKVFANMGAVDDGGVTARVFGSLITWLQEKTAPVFVVATANNIGGSAAPTAEAGAARQTGLPPELLRKGRFDEIFFVDLPTFEERKDIFAVHLKKRGYDPLAFDLDALATASENYNGAEIEQSVLDALYMAFAMSSTFMKNIENQFKELNLDMDQLRKIEESIFQETVYSNLETEITSDQRYQQFHPDLSYSAVEERIKSAGLSEHQFQKAVQAVSSAFEQFVVEEGELPFGLTQPALESSLANVVPLYTMRQGEIEEQRRWAADNTRPASRRRADPLRADQLKKGLNLQPKKEENDVPFYSNKNKDSGY